MSPTKIAPPVATVLFALASCGGDEPAVVETVEGEAQTRPMRRDDDPPTARRRTLEDLRADHAAIRHPSDGGGKAWLELDEGDDGSVRASGHRSWTILYEAGEAGVAVGGSVRFLTPPFWEWSQAQSALPEESGYTTVESLAEGVELEVLFGDWTIAEIRGRALEAGERLRITYGAGPAGAKADRYAERGAPFWISVDGDGDRVPGILRDSPRIDIRPGPPFQLMLLSESVTRPGEPTRLIVSLLDRVGNRGTNFEGTVTLQADPPGVTLPGQLVFTLEDGGHKTVEFTAPDPGVVRIRGMAELPRRNLDAVSNPTLVSQQSPSIYWGDLHGHSHLSDGTGEPEDFFEYARDISGLDVVSLTDHDHWGVRFIDQNPDMWARIRELTETYNDPGRFVTILGYEWTSWIHGHRHVLYFGDDGPVLSSIDPDYETPTQLWEGLRARELKALTFAHHSAGGPIATDWSFAPDPEFEPVTEITSVHGCSEASDAPNGIYRPLRGNYVRDVLDRGYRFGFIGSGDSHDGHPGLAHLSSRTSGLAAILAGDLSRQGVLDAMHGRRVYATNGARILLQCALGGERMGASVPAPQPGESSAMFLRVIACAPLEYIDLIRNGSVQRIPAEGRLDLSLEIEVPELEVGDYVYVRAVQEDRFAAWSSPFFIVAADEDQSEAASPPDAGAESADEPR